MSDSPASILFDQFGTEITTVSGTDGVRLGVNTTISGSLPLPSGAATEATLALIKAKTDNLDVALSTRAITGLTDAQLRASSVPVSDGGGSLTVDGPLTNTELRSSPVTVSGTITQGLGGTSAWKVDGSAVTQPISAVSLPLPAGASTSALQTQPGVDIGDVTVNNAAGAAAVNIQDGGNSITVDATALPLPAGASTAALQTAGNISLTSIDQKTPLLGQATLASGIPVSIASNQTVIPVSDNAGSLTVDAISWPLPAGAATQATLVTLLSGTTFTSRIDTLEQNLQAQSIVDNAGFTDGTTRIQPAGYVFDEVAGTALTENDAAAARIDSKRAQILTLEDATTRGQRLAVTISGAARVDGSGTVQPVWDGGFSLTVDTPQLPTALSAGRLDINTGAWLGSTAPTVGQKAMTSSIPTVISSDQSAIPTKSEGLTNTTVPTQANLAGGKDPSGNLQPIALSIEQSLLVAQAPNTEIVQNNSTITVTGSSIFDFYGVKEVTLFVNVKNSPTGTTPTLTYTIQEVDPGDKTTVLGTSASGASITAIGTQIITLPITRSGVIKVSWVVTGTTPSFTGVYATLVSKATGAQFGVDSTGTFRVLSTDTTGNLQTVSIGAPSGSLADISFGDATIAAPGTYAMRRTTYTEQTVNFTGSIKSGSVNDTAAGTGARTVKITYLDQTGTGPLTETVTLNGTTAVNLVNSNHCFIEKMEVLSAGSGGVNAGLLSLFTGAAGAGTLVGTIAVGDNQTFWCHHYTPVGKTTYIAGTLVGNSSSVVGGGCTFALKSKSVLVANSIEKQVGDTLTLYGQSSMTPRLFTTAIPLATGLARITMYAFVTSSTSIVYRASFDFYDK